MKQSELLRRIARAARSAGVSFSFVRHGGKHDVYSFGGQQVFIPRHADVNEMTARSILRDLGI
jgi:mRNA interferase HicA